jgi:hypothetical protein
LQVQAPKVTLAILALVAAAPAAQAFASIQKGDSPHDEITAVAADLGWPEDAVEALQAGVRQPDVSDLQKAPIEGDEERVDASVTFRPWHHCGRVPPTADDQAFNATVAYVRHERGLAENLSLVDPAAAMRALGRALHALQDCFSHSNAVDLPPAAQQALAQALVHGGDAPAGLRLCGVQPGALDIERPPGDAYSHADFNKDDEEASPEAEAVLADGRTKHEHARALATDATRDFLADFMAGLDGDASARLLAVDDDTFRLDDRDGGDGGPLGVPGPGPFMPLALAVAAALRRRPA